MQAPARMFWGPLAAFGLATAVIACALDQASKLWLLQVYGLADKGVVKVMPFVDVVLTWNTSAVVTSEDLKINAQLAIPGSHAKLALVRDGKRIERDVVLRAAQIKGVTPPHPASCAQTREPAMAAVEDFDVQEIPPARAGGLPGGRGVSVTRVTDHGAADQAGLKVGDIVLRIGKASVRTQTDVTTALNGYKPGDMLPMLVRRTGFDFWMAFSRR